MCKNLFGEESHTRCCAPPRNLEEARESLEARTNRVRELIYEGIVTHPSVRLSAFSMRDALENFERRFIDAARTSHNGRAVSRVRDGIAGLWHVFNLVSKGEIPQSQDDRDWIDFRDSRDLLRHCAVI